MTMLQIGGIGILGALLALQFKGGKSEYGVFIGIAVSLLLFFAISGRLEVILAAVRQISGLLHLENAYLSILLKMLGVTYVAEFASGICRDAGYQTIAGQIEVFAKLTLLALGMPVFQALLQTIQEFLR